MICYVPSREIEALCRHYTMSTSTTKKEISGWIQMPFVDESADQSDDGHEEDEDEELLLDYVDSGGVVTSKKTKMGKVTIVDSNNKQHVCNGRFPLQQKFWTVGVEVKNNWLKSNPAYSIRPGPNCLDSWHVMSLLDDCFYKKIPIKTSNATKACFEIFCNRKANESLSLFNMESLLEDYINSEETGCQFDSGHGLNVGRWPVEDHSKNVRKLVLGSGLAATAVRAVSHPDLVHAVSKLLPYSFQGFFSHLKKKFANQAASMAKLTPWQYGFRQILSKKFNILGAEAQLSAFEKGGYFQEMPQLYKDALYIYEILKVDSTKNGHMYIPFRKLVNYYYFAKLDYRINEEQRWNEALNYLQRNAVIIMEDFDQDRNIFIKHNWQAEVDVAAGVKKMLENYSPSLDNYLDFDFSCSDFDKIRKDPDQVTALQSAAHLPVTVLSGSGGCGKTTVVTTLLKHVCDREEERLLQGEQLFSQTTAPENEELSQDLGSLSVSNQHQNPTQENISVSICPHGKSGNENIKTEMTKVSLSPKFNLVKTETDGTSQSSQINSVKTEIGGSSQSSENSVIKTEIADNQSLQNNFATKDKIDTYQDPINKNVLKEIAHQSQTSLSETHKEGITDESHTSYDDLTRQDMGDPSISSQNDSQGPKTRSAHQPSSHKSNSAVTDIRSNISSQDSAANTDDQTSSSDEATEIHSTLRETLVSDLIKILKQEKGEDSTEMQEFKRQFLLTAPTGKAARLLGCKASLPSATIHSVIMSWRKYHTEGRFKIPVTPWRYEDVRVLIVDECSLVSVRLFSSVLNILLKKAQLCKIILLGDIKQLPSIEPGDFLRDLFSSLSHPGLSFRLTRNHRSESSLIVENAKKISARQLPTFDADRRFHLIELQENGEDYERDESIREILENNCDVNCHIQSQFVTFRNSYCQAINELCCKFYNGHSTMKEGSRRKQVQDFRPGDKICLSKNSLVNNNHSLLLDYVIGHEYFREKYHPMGKTGGQKRPDKSLEDSDLNCSRRNNVLTAAEATSLFEGDEEDLDRTVMAMEARDRDMEKARRERIEKAAQQSKAWKTSRGIQGGDDPESAPASKEDSSQPNLPFPKEAKLCNGEVFFIMDEINKAQEHETGGNHFVLSDRDPYLPNVVCVSERELRRQCKMKHSWARTIHTYQGSESQTVVYVVGNAIPQNCQHVYTAVTRGKKSVYIVSKPSQLQIAVNRCDNPRQSRLRHRLQEMLHDSSDLLDKIRSNCRPSINHQLHKLTMDGQPTTSLADQQQQGEQLPDSSFDASNNDSFLSPLPGPSMIIHSNVGNGPEQRFAPQQNAQVVESNNTFHRGEIERDNSPFRDVNMSPVNKVSPATTKTGSFRSPPKTMRLDSSAVDTPFRDSFSQTLSLSLDVNESQDSEDPFPSRKSVRRKL